MRVEFFFDFTCPYAYLGSLQIGAICARASADLQFRPLLLGGLFRALGLNPSGLMDAMPAQKTRYLGVDLQRFARRVGKPLRYPAGHPLRSVRALRAVLALPMARRAPLIHGIYKAYWQDNLDIAQPAVVEQVLIEAGYAPDERARALAANDAPAVKQALIEATDEAVARGVFGVPAFFVDGTEMFFGQDRLEMLGRALGLPPTPPSPAPPQSTRHVDFWFDFSSPFTYLAATQIERICAEANATLSFQPMLLGAVFKNLGTANVPLFTMPPAKRAYVTRDMQRWAKFWGVPLQFPKHFPIRSVTPLRLVMLAGARARPLTHALFRAAWVEDQNLEDEAVLEKILTDQQLDPALLARTREPAIKQALIDSTARAVEQGIFGAPSMVLTEGEHRDLFWGQDRLPALAAALR